MRERPRKERVEPADTAREISGRVARNSVWLIARPLSLNLLSIASNAYIARELGAADYGVFQLGYAQIALFAPLCNLGLRAVAVRAIAEEREQAREVAQSVLALRLLFTALAVLLALGWLALPAWSPATRLVGLAAVGSMLFTSLGTVFTDVCQGLERARLAAQAQLAGGLALTLLSVLALAAGLGLPGFTAAYVLGAGLQTALLVGACRRHFFPVAPAWRWERLKDLALQARPFALMSAMSALIDPAALDVIVVGALFGSGGIGPFSAAIGLATRLLMIPCGIADAIYPAVAARYREHPEEVAAVVRRYVRNTLLVTAPIALCLSLSAPTALRVLYGSEYLAGAPVLALAAWLVPLAGLRYLATECLSAVRKQGTVLRISMASAGALGALYLVCIPLLGPEGAVVAGLLREGVALSLLLPALCRAFPRAVPGLELARLASALAAMMLPFLPPLRLPGHAGTIAAASLSLVLFGLTAARAGLVDPGFLRLRHGGGRDRSGA